MARGRPRKASSLSGWLKKPSGEWTMTLQDGHMIKITCTDMVFDLYDGFHDFNSEYHPMNEIHGLKGLQELIAALSYYCFRELYAVDEVNRIVDVLDTAFQTAQEETEEDEEVQEPDDQQEPEEEEE